MDNPFLFFFVNEAGAAGSPAALLALQVVDEGNREAVLGVNSKGCFEISHRIVELVEEIIVWFPSSR
jgi:hypothetical protein